MATKSLNIRGSLVALVTPMFSDGSIDWQTYYELIEWHIRQGTAALVVMGSTGETPTIAPNDHLELIRVAVHRAAGRIPIIGGVGANSTSEAVELTVAAYEAGVTACLSVVPYYNKPTQEGLVQHFRAVAQSCDVPVILYDVPSRTVIRMSVETIVSLAEVPNIVGLKDATGDIARANELFSRLPEDFSIFSGDDGSAGALILLGAQGNISVTANVLPAVMRDLCEAALVGDVATVRVISRRLASLNQALFVESNPIPVKWALARMGKIRPGIRLPLTHLSASSARVLELAMVEAGIECLSADASPATESV